MRLLGWGVVAAALCAAAPTLAADEQSELAKSYDTMAARAELRGQFDQALEHRRAVLAIRRTQAAAAPKAVEAQLNLGVALMALGGAQSAMGDDAAAAKSQADARKLLETLLKANPDDPAVVHSFAALLERQSDLAKNANDLATAKALLTESLALRQRQANRPNASDVALRSLTVVQVRLSDVLRRQGDAAGAIALSDQALQQRRALLTKHPTASMAQEDLISALHQRGDVSFFSNDFAAAQPHFAEALKLARIHQRSETRSVSGVRFLKESLHKMGLVARAQNDLAAAKGYFAEAVDVSRHLAQALPQSAQAQQDLGEALTHLGRVMIALKDAAGASAALREAAELLRPLYTAKPTVDGARALISALSLLGSAAKDPAPHREAAQLLEGLKAQGVAFQSELNLLNAINQQLSRGR